MPASPTPAHQPEARRRQAMWTLALWMAIIVGALIVIGVLLVGGRPERLARPHPSIVAGSPGGVAIPIPTSSPVATAEPTLVATPEATTPPTPAPTPAPARVEPTPAPTPRATTPPATTTPATPVPATAAPTPIVVAAADPADAVAAFYGNAAAGNFDAAYSIWSERMRITYPRPENLDGRFDETAGITFQQLYVAEQVGDRATVQANFIETYETGSSREFVGYWRLIFVDGRWLLDEPHY